MLPRLPNESNLNYSLRWTAWEREQRATQYEAELAASDANDGKVALPDLAEITAEKEAAIAEQTKLTTDAGKETDATKKAELVKAAESAELQKVYQEKLERIVKGEPTKEDEELLAKMQESHDAECEDKRAWLAKRKE